MKKIVFVFSVVLASCGDQQSKQNEPSVGASQTQQTQEKAAVESPSVQPYFRGLGNEPGWNITMDAATNGTFPVVIIFNYGKDTLSGILAKEGLVANGKNNLTSGEAKFSGTLEGLKSGENVSVSLISEECIDDADKKHSHRCSVIIDGKTLRGCGDYSE